MKSKQELVEFLKSVVHNYKGGTWFENIADQLISNGLVEIKEPREFWVVIQMGKKFGEPIIKYHVCSDKNESENVAINIGGGEILHVKEVLNDS